MEISKVYNANVYVGTTTNLIGRASEIGLPEIAAVTEDHQALAMIGKLKLPTGLEAMEGTIKWNSFHPDRFKYVANPYASRQIQARANVETFGPSGRMSSAPLVVLMTATFSKGGLGSLTPQAQSDYEDTFSVTYLKVSLAAKALVEIDVHANVWVVDGVDLLAAFRTNLGV